MTYEYVNWARLVFERIKSDRTRGEGLWDENEKRAIDLVLKILRHPEENWLLKKVPVDRETIKAEILEDTDIYSELKNLTFRELRTIAKKLEVSSYGANRKVDLAKRLYKSEKVTPEILDEFKS